MAMRLICKEAQATIKLATPMIFGSASMIIMGLVDSLMIGRVGIVPLAASAFTNSIYSFLYIVGLGVLLPVAVLVSRSHGSNRPAECAIWLRHGLVLALGAGLASCLLMGILSLRLDLFQQPREVITEAIPFYLLFAISLIPSLLSLVLRQYAESLGFPWVPMGILFFSVALNAGLNWVLIYGNLGMPPLGLTGAGVATLSSRSLSVLALVLWLRWKLQNREEWPVNLTISFSWLRNLSRSYFAELIRLGLPSSGQLMFEVCAFSAAGVMMGWLGTTELAAHQIALSCASLTFMVPLGISTAAGMRISRALGAGEKQRLRPIGLSAFGLAWIFMLCFAIAFAFEGKTIASWFIQDAEGIAMGSRLLFVAALFQLFDGTQVVGSGLLRGLSDVRVPTLITGVAYWLIAIPVSYFWGVRHIGPDGIWGGLAVGLSVAAAALLWRFLRFTR